MLSSKILQPGNEEKKRGKRKQHCCRQSCSTDWPKHNSIYLNTIKRRTDQRTDQPNDRLTLFIFFFSVCLYFTNFGQSRGKQVVRFERLPQANFHINKKNSFITARYMRKSASQKEKKEFQTSQKQTAKRDLADCKKKTVSFTKERALFWARAYFICMNNFLGSPRGFGEQGSIDKILNEQGKKAYF